MDFRFTSAQEAFRAELRQWLQANLPGDLRGRAFASSRCAPDEVEKLRAWQKGMCQAGYVGLDWPPEFGGHMYRPLVIASFAIDRLVDGAVWYHVVNLLWHAGAAVAVAALARRWLDPAGALVAGLLFAVDPVHVEAVANVVGRAELMAAVFSVLTVYAALAGKPAVWSAAAFALGLLSKENAAVAPALVVWAWTLGLERPERRRMVSLVTSWVVVGAAYGVIRALVRHPFGGYTGIAPNANLIDVRVLDAHGLGQTSDVLAGIDWVIAHKTTHNIRVLNMSLGTAAVDSYAVDPLCLAVRSLVDSLDREALSRGRRITRPIAADVLGSLQAGQEG